MRILMMAFLTLVWTPVFAAERSVTLHPDSQGEIVIYNPSEHDVDIRVECYDKNTGGPLPAEDLTVLKKLKARVGGAETQCGSGFSPRPVDAAGRYACHKDMGSADFTNDLSTACGTNSVCTIPEMAGVSIGSLNLMSAMRYYIRPNLSNGAWSTHSSPSIDTNHADVSSSAPTIGPSVMATNSCSSQPAQGGTTLSSCEASTLITGQGFICCAPGFNKGQCKVTIKSQNHPAAYLSSPAFKGGSPF